MAIIHGFVEMIKRNFKGENMKKFMDWLANVFAPTMNKLFSRPWIAAVSSSMQKIIPFILTGSIIYFYNVIRSFVPALPDLGPVVNYSFGLIALILAFVIGQQCMEKLNKPFYTTNCGLVSMAVLLMFTMPGIDEAGNMIILNGRLGPAGIAVGMFAGLFVSIIFNLYSKLHLFENSTSIPDFVTGWINYIFPTLIVLITTMVLTTTFNIDIYEFIIWVLSPLISFGSSLPGIVLICLIQAMLYSMGISSWVTGAITTPIFLAGIQANIAAVAAGLPATNIVTSEACMTAGLMALGGCGATLTLNILFCFSKAKKLRTMGKIFLAPSIFNINEPIVFGAPIAFNPILMLPMWINSVVGPLIIYSAMYFGLLNIPSKLMQIGQIPAPFSSVMITEDFRALIWYVVMIVVNTLIWYPFYKVFERQCLKEENAIDQQEVS